MVMASEIIVHAAMINGIFATAIPQFGFERRGSPVISSVRLDDHPIREKTQIYSPNCIVVSDETLLSSVNVYNGIQEGACMVLNTTKNLQALGVPSEITLLGLIDATNIALEIIGAPITNTAMIGAFAKTTGWFGIDLVTEGIRRVLAPALIDKNVRAALNAFAEVRIYHLERDYRYEAKR